MANAPAFHIRPIQTYDEYIAVADLQREVWGQESIEIVPPSILMVNQKIGGIVAGAFLKSGELVAFVYGLPGFREGQEVHWSHMLAVKPAWRGHGLGRRLKQFQREFVEARDIDIVHWTYDPLESVNAALNLRNLGALPREYVLDLYGKGEKSILHRGIGTDRFILTWFMRPEARALHLSQFYAQEVLWEAPAVISDTLTFVPDLQASVVLVEIPASIQTLKQNDPDEARSWRDATRAAFLHYFGAGFTVIDFIEHPETKRLYYVMAARK